MYRVRLILDLQEEDPFWEDSSTEVLIGTVHMYLQSIGYLIEIEETLNISDYRGAEKGRNLIKRF